MRRILVPLLVGILLLTIQTTLLMALPIQRIRPDLILILIVYLGFAYPPVSGGILAFIFGYLTDLFSGNALGLFTFSRPLIFFAVQFFKGRFYLESPAAQFLSALTSALVEGLLLLALLAGLNPDPLRHLFPLFVSFLLPQALMTSFITPFLFPLFRRCFSLLFDVSEAGIQEKA